MAIDFDAIKRKLERLSGNVKSTNVMWKPTEGEEHTVRLLSFPDNDGQPFKELQFYYNISVVYLHLLSLDKKTQFKS